jgi:hypothetical protein
VKDGREEVKEGGGYDGVERERGIETRVGFYVFAS